jgi:hypothetical protein
MTVLLRERKVIDVRLIPRSDADIMALRELQANQILRLRKWDAGWIC